MPLPMIAFPRLKTDMPKEALPSCCGGNTKDPQLGLTVTSCLKMNVSEDQISSYVFRLIFLLAVVLFRVLPEQNLTFSFDVIVLAVRGDKNREQ